MKKTLTLLALMIAVAGSGQNTIRSADTTDVSLWQIGEEAKRGILFTIDALPKYDTVAIVYLYSDTARMMSIVPTTYIINERLVEKFDTAYYKPDNKTYWDFGYEVREETGLIPVTSRENNMLYDWVMSYKFVGYLDRHKRPIRKSIVLFMSKTIEK